MKKSLQYALCAIVLLFGSAGAQTKLTLDECRRLAMQNSTSSRNSALNIEYAHQTRQSALTNYFPSVSAGALAFKAKNPLMDISTSGGDLPVYDGNPDNLPNASLYAYMPASSIGMMKSGSIGFINIMQPVFAGGRIINGNKLAVLGEEVSELQARLERNTTLRTTDEKYWQLASLMEKRKTIRRYTELLDEIYRKVDDAHRSGIATMNDLLKVKLKRSEVALNRSRLDNGIALAIMAFCQHLKIPYDSTLAVTDTLAAGDMPGTYHIEHAEALKTRAEYALLEASVRAEELQTRMKLGEYLPQLAVGLNGTIMKLDESESRTIGMVFGTVSVPISSWWDASHALEGRSLKEEIAHNNFKENAELLTLQMEKDWRDLTDAYTQVQLSAEAVRQAEENLRVNQDGYANGVVAVSDVLDAQASLQQALDQWTDSKAAYRIKVVTYLQVTGR
jgi:outer membrane protein TolC